ncbi:conserved hypothetical protein [Verticillium alfalfae VaMs.102]|uniref:Transmembrane protein 42 n=1 Tax=Verticillium alfalfae (strain VaMs.102 / ATCC MYA-4576 / FGSC 10136) TaxID=526221 RepID=C9S7U0_VERA1|nr:conserved hypothetical protein [Verticillium alfalfae VaMs.102]EEY14825.1 conserved hypothetical protein [Verticillium alfalfae VaMs.102]
MLRQRQPKPSQQEQRPRASINSIQPQTGDQSPIFTMSWAEQNKWVVLAIASGACAAFNGVFAKLTTTQLTTTIASSLSKMLHLTSVEGAFEVVLRAVFFGLNLLFNGIMWTLFTKALAKGSSTTRVSIINTSSNFVLTALLGLIIFSESLPPMWWFGAFLLVAGNVIVGRKDDSAGEEATDGGYAAVPQQPALVPDSPVDERGPKVNGYNDDEDIIDLGDLSTEGSNGQGRR